MFNIRKSFSDIQSLKRSTFPFFNAFNVHSVALSDKTFILHSLFAHCSLIVQLDDNIFRLITINTVIFMPYRESSQFHSQTFEVMQI